MQFAEVCEVGDAVADLALGEPGTVGEFARRQADVAFRVALLGQGQQDEPRATF
ncbi:hypothetical protein [Streptomyces sp. NPDC048172]|uniref:hypothetical protein n=1 Tax=Streptomyces sp. NPDC048172 TaxID=3365505 RepID=UPI0037129326